MADYTKLASVIQRLRDIRTNKGRGARSPHKYVLLKAVVQLYARRPDRLNAFPLESELEDEFINTWLEWFPETDPKAILIEHPYYHLTTDGLWNLEVKEGKQELFDKYEQSPGMRLTRRRLVETVKCARVDSELDDCLRDEAPRAAVARALDEELGKIVDPHVRKGRSSEQQESGTSLFAHERGALEAIEQRVAGHALGRVLSNLELHDSQSNRYFEVDAVVVSSFGIYVVELKHWSGLIQVRPNSWVQNRSFMKPDPHKVNNFKAKLLRGLYEREFPHYPSVWFESVVVLTNPDVTVVGEASPSTTSSNPTFGSINRFIRYLKHQQESKGDLLEQSQRDAFVEFLRGLQVAAPPRDFVFPGYEIVERLYQHDDRAELVARRTDIRHRRLSRLRIFFPPTRGDDRERALFHERATATLNAVAKTGDHPSILKVWSVPNESNFIVEGSDWSETGTLRDRLSGGEELPRDTVIQISLGILEGLDVLHRELVVHRALAPENVMMAEDTPKLMNFDLSYQLEEDRTTVIPDVAGLRRTPYMAPEVYAGGVTPEATTDLFSVGVMLYEMLVGKTPFACSLDLAQMGGELTDEHVQRLREADVPESMSELVRELVRTEQSKRPSGTREVIERLRTAQLAPEPVLVGNPRLEPGARSGLYEIEEFVAAGTQSQVYRARGARAKAVAVKMFNSDVTLQHVVEEQRLAGTAHHPSLVRVDSYSRWDNGRFYIAFDWVSSRSLRNDIIEGERPTLERFRSVASDLLHAVNCLHAAEVDPDGAPVVHNDIKPDNILLTEGGRPVLIDFGCACPPRIGLYQGTDGYVAPDLQLGADRNCCADGDLYAVGVTLHEWLLGRRPGGNGETARLLSELGLPAGLADWFARATAPSAEARFVSAREMLDALDPALSAAVQPAIEELPIAIPAQGQEERRAVTRELARLEPVTLDESHPNPFVAYLNSLHSRSAASENALAESQARNEFFGFIHVPHPVTELAEEILRGDERVHVILTGHAGDGKSTIALELCKRLQGVPADQPLDRDLSKRIPLPATGDGKLHIIKDLSEWSRSDRGGLLDEMLSPGQDRFFMVSNTGTLLEAFKDVEQRRNGDVIGVESQLLRAMSSSSPERWEYRGTAFTIINLSMMDNLAVARQILERMLADERWEVCESNKCKDRCPIYRNVRLFQANHKTALERIFLAYRRMYEYGVRLTLRQLSAHLAYMITSGLSHSDIVRMSQRASSPLMSEFMFFNRFFGDNGRQEDPPAFQLRAVREVRKQGFGTRTAPTWERRLWLQKKGPAFRLRASGCDKEFEILRQYGAGTRPDSQIAGDLARNQVRRIVFFLHEFGAQDDGSFLRTFLNSPTILRFSQWQTDSTGELSLTERRLLHQRILHVLQEQFTGVRLPEGTAGDGYLFVTLSRRSQEVRQSAQVVLARIPEEDLTLELVTRRNCAGGDRRDLVLKGRPSRLNARLKLGLPFLDYVIMRNHGEVGEILETSYVDRLERFKGQLLDEMGSERSDDVMLVRLQTNLTFRRQVFAVRHDRLEVTDG